MGPFAPFSSLAGGAHFDANLDISWGSKMNMAETRVDVDKCALNMNVQNDKMFTQFVISMI